MIIICINEIARKSISIVSNYKMWCHPSVVRPKVHMYIHKNISPV